MATATTATKNVHQRKLAVMARCGEIAPDKTHPHHKFDYVSIQTLSNHLRLFLAEEGLDYTAGIDPESRLLRIDLINADQPEERITSYWPLVPEDKGYAYSVKYPLMRLFLVGDGEEGDEAEVAKSSGKAATKQRQASDQTANKPSTPRAAAEPTGPPPGEVRQPPRESIANGHRLSAADLKDVTCPECGKTGTGIYLATQNKIACAAGKGGCGRSFDPPGVEEPKQETLV